MQASCATPVRTPSKKGLRDHDPGRLLRCPLDAGITMPQELVGPMEAESQGVGGLGVQAATSPWAFSANCIQGLAFPSGSLIPRAAWPLLRGCEDHIPGVLTSRRTASRRQELRGLGGGGGHGAWLGPCTLASGQRAGRAQTHFLHRWQKLRLRYHFWTSVKVEASSHE